MDSTKAVIPTVKKSTAEKKVSKPWPVWVRAVLTSSAVALLLFAVVSGFAYKWGSYSLALDYLAGSRVVMTPGIAYLENLDFTNDVQPVEFTIANMSDHPIAIVRQRVTCGCISKIQLPVAIPSGEKIIVVVPVRLKGRDPGQPFRERVAFTTDDPDHFELSALIHRN